MPQKVEEIERNRWVSCKCLNPTELSNYKLHVYMPVEYFDLYEQRVYALLKNAVIDGVIPRFKKLSDPYENSSVDETRIVNNPFTIYLHQTHNVEQIADLCWHLEFILRNTPSCNRKHLSAADLPLSQHLTLRQENINGIYIPIAEAKEEIIEALKTLGERSNEYTNLKTSLDNDENEFKKKINAASQIEIKKEENEIQAFYDTYFNYYLAELQAEDPSKQFKAACSLLDINDEIFRKVTDKNEWVTIIRSKYRKISLKYHPDKIPKSPILASTKQKAAQIWNLISCSTELLERFAEAPSLLDKTELLKQKSYLPQYQFELAGGYTSDVHHYINMAKNNRLVKLKCNWDYTFATREIQPSDQSNSFAIQIYESPLTEYKNTQRELTLPGHEAFFHLFVSGALADIDQYRFSYIFDEPFNDSQKWLIKKALVTPYMISFMDTNLLQKLATYATKEGLIDIGSSTAEVLIYYYLHFPETLDLKRIRKFKKMGNLIPDLSLNPNLVAKAIIKSPQQLLSLPTEIQLLDEIAEIHPALHKYLVKNKEFIAKLSNQYIKDKIIKLYRENIPNDFPEFYPTIIDQLIYGNDSFLPFLSDNVLKELMTFIQANNNIPGWIYLDIARQIGQKPEECGPYIPPKSSEWRYELIDAKKHIKQIYLNNNETGILSYLSKNALIELANEPEAHWSRHYLPISHALHRLGETEAAKEYLIKIAENLGIKIADQSIEELSEELEKHNDALNVKYSEWYDARVSELLTNYEQILSEQKDGDLNAIATHLDNLDKRSKRYLVEEKIFKSYRNKLGELIDRLRKRENSHELKQDIQSFRNKLDNPVFIECKKNHPCGPIWKASNDLYGLIKSLISPPPADTELNRNQQQVEFCIDLGGDVLANLEHICYLYECCVSVQEFYQVLGTYTSPITSPPPIFDKDFIEAHLTEYLKDELTVFTYGRRVAIPYKADRSTSEYKIKSFSEIRNLYIRFGKEELFNTMLPMAYKTLLQEEKNYDPAPYLARRENYSRSHPYTKNVYPEDDVTRPLTKYIEIRKYQTETQPFMESLAFRHLFHALIESKYQPLTKTKAKPGFFDTAAQKTLILQEKALTLREQINNEFQKTTPAFSEEQIFQSTERMLNHLATFLRSYSDSPLYNQLIEDIRSTPILRDYLQLLGSQTQSNQATATTIAKGITDGTIIKSAKIPASQRKALTAPAQNDGDTNTQTRENDGNSGDNSPPNRRNGQERDDISISITNEPNQPEPSFRDKFNNFIDRYGKSILIATLAGAVSGTILGASIGLSSGIFALIPTGGLSILATPVAIGILAGAGFIVGALSGLIGGVSYALVRSKREGKPAKAETNSNTAGNSREKREEDKVNERNVGSSPQHSPPPPGSPVDFSSSRSPLQQHALRGAGSRQHQGSNGQSPSHSHNHQHKH